MAQAQDAVAELPQQVAAAAYVSLNEVYPRRCRHHEAQQRDKIPRRCEARENAVQVRTRRGEEVHEHRNLRHERQRRQHDNHQRVHDALRHHRAEPLRKRHTVAALQASASHHLAHTRHHEARGVGYEDSVLRRRTPRMLVQGVEGKAPAPGAYLLRQHAKHQAEQHPAPVHLSADDLQEALPVGASVHPPQDSDAQNERQKQIQRALHVLLFLELISRCLMGVNFALLDGS